MKTIPYNQEFEFRFAFRIFKGGTHSAMNYHYDYDKN